MGVILRNMNNNKIIYYLKGADNVMISKLKRVYTGIV